MKTLKTAFLALAVAGTLAACAPEPEVEAPAADAVVAPEPVAPIAPVDTMAMDTTVMMDDAVVPADTL